MNHSDRVTFGFWIYIMSDCVLFASLFATFAVLRTATFGGPSGGELFSLPFALVETLILLTSSFTVGLAMLAGYLGKKEWVLRALAATLLLGVSFLALELREFHSFVAEGHSWQESAFLSSFFALVGTHGFHVFLGSLWMLLLMTHISAYGLVGSTVRKLVLLGFFWHFLDIVWIFIFTFVYLYGLL